MNLIVGLLIMLLFGTVGAVRYAYGPEYAEVMLIVSALGIAIHLLLDRRHVGYDLPPAE